MPSSTPANNQSDTNLNQSSTIVENESTILKARSCKQKPCKIIRGYQGGDSKIFQGLKSLRGLNLPRPKPESFSKSLNMAISNSQRFFEITP